MNKRIILLPLLFFFQWIIAQDAHFSHIWNETAEVNPAATAFRPACCATEGRSQEIRLGTFYRTQWLSLPQPYQHFGVIADINFNQLGLGLSVFSNRAGAASLKTTTARLTGAWHAKLASNAKLSIGFGAGMLQKRVNPAFFKFDKQYVQGQGFDNNNGTGESFLVNNAIGFDLSGGAEFQVPLSLNTTFRGGLAIDHVNQQKFSFIDVNKTGIYTKWTSYAQLEYQATDLLSFTPRAAYRMQGPAKEILLGLEGGYQINEQNLLKLGAANRLKDAFILNAGIEFKQLEVGLSYDLNISRLKAASNGNGAFEFMLIYVFNRQAKERHVDISTQPPTAVSNDRDGDGIPDHLDDCPDLPGKYRFQGCSDRDEDGIWDEDDRCPNLFGVRENAGCPARLNDTDGDGVLDHADNCVFIKGDPAQGGCPDTDKDGIIDSEDACPYLRGVREKNGCPTEIDRTTETTKPLPQVRLQNAVVFFDTDKAIIKPEYYSILTEMARVLKSYPEVEVLLSGHTDEEGSVSYNFSLSERRNLAVRNYLLAQGIDATQIRLLAYGETIPKASNTTFDGKAKNRRVEVVILQ